MLLRGNVEEEEWSFPAKSSGVRTRVAVQVVSFIAMFIFVRHVYGAMMTRTVVLAMSTNSCLPCLILYLNMATLHLT